jgi:hypothetical protein
MRIVRDDGVLGLFRGGGPTVVRAMALNMGMLASNDQAKEMLEAAGFKGQTAVLGGAMIAGAGCVRGCGWIAWCGGWRPEQAAPSVAADADLCCAVSVRCVVLLACCQ